MIYDRFARRLGSALTICLLSCVASSAAEPIWAARDWQRKKVEKDPAREGLERIQAVFHSYPDHVLAISCKQLVDPKNGDALVNKGYGDHQISFHSIGRWGWSFENFFGPEITITKADGKTGPVRLGALTSLNILEGKGRRVMGDFRWPLLDDGSKVGSLILRCVTQSGQPTWLYGRAFIIGDPSLSFKRLTLSSFGGAAGTPPPGRQQMLAGLTAHGAAPSPGPLSMDEYWMIAAHNRGWSTQMDNRGSCGVFLKDELNGIDYKGGGSVSLLPALSSPRALRFAISDFKGDPDEWVPKLRGGAVSARRALEGMDWRPDAAKELAALDDVAAPMLKRLGGDAQIVKSWLERRKLLCELAEAAAAANPGSMDDLALGEALQQARLFLEDDATWNKAIEELMPHDKKK